MDAPLTPDQVEFAIAELACLHRQVVERVRCPHRPAHEDLEAALLRIRGKIDANGWKSTDSV